MRHAHNMNLGGVRSSCTTLFHEGQLLTFLIQVCKAELMTESWHVVATQGYTPSMLIIHAGWGWLIENAGSLWYWENMGGCAEGWKAEGSTCVFFSKSLNHSFPSNEKDDLLVDVKLPFCFHFRTLYTWVYTSAVLLSMDSVSGTMKWQFRGKQ